MTAYSHARVDVDLGHFVLEIQTVNRKHLELQIYLPIGLQRFDSEIRKWVAAEISRGQVSIRLFANFQKQSPVHVRPNLPFVKQLKHAWEMIAEATGIDKSAALDLKLMQNVDGVFLIEESLPDDSGFQNILQQLFQEALDKLIEVKLREGKVIEQEILARFDTLNVIIVNIEKQSPQSSLKQRQKLKAKLEEVLPGCVENEEKLLREISLYAEKVDISEEILRFNSHLLQCKYLFESNEKQIGKKLEFILQELNREINTIGSKASDYEISKQVVETKSELEKIREQIQNIE